MKESIKNFLRPIAQRLKRLDYIIFYDFYKLTTKQDEKKVAMLSDSRESLSGNLEFIKKELDGTDYEVVFFGKKNLSVKKTLKEKKELMRLIAVSKYVLVDDFYPIIYPLKIRKNTEIIQVWHAMGAFKTVGYSRVGKVGGPKKRTLTHRNYTACITSSDSIRGNYSEAFHIDINKVYATGVPRTDIFFDEEYIKKTKEKIYKKYPKLKDKKVILFAPTFRGNGQKTAHYDFNLIDFEKLKKEFKGEYIFINKLHPFIKNNDEIPSDDDFYLDLTDEREINDLLFITDILITDYSSVIFEYSFLNKPLIFYVPDLDDYIESRSFYYPFSKYTYGDVAYNMDELIKYIKNSKIDNKKLQEFKDYFCKSCDGKSTKRFVSTFFDDKYMKKR